MLKAGKQRDEIIKKFSILRYYVEYSNKIGKTDINLELEDFFCGLFNIVRRTKFYNVNNEEKNFPAIDLANDELRTAIQITSNCRKKKIETTIIKFKENEFYNRWNNLEIFIIGKKNKNMSISSNQNFKVKITDMDDLYSQIISSINSEIRQKVIEYLSKELEINIEPIKNQLRIPNIEADHFSDAKAFIVDYMEEKNDEYIIDMIEKLRGLCYEIMLLSKEQRIYIYSAIERTIDYNSNGILFSFEDMDMYFGNEEQAEKVLNSLIAKGIVTQEMYEKNDTAFWAGKIKSNKESFDVELLIYIVSFCKKKERDLDKFLLKLDFSILD